MTMIEKSRPRWGLMFLLVCVMVACGPATPIPTPQASPALVEPTANRTPEPTEAPAATITPPPLPTPTPTPTPVPTEPVHIDEGSALDQHRLAMRPEFAGDLEALNPLPRYSIEVTVDPGETLVRGSQVVDYVNRDTLPQTQVYFRLFPNLPGYGGEMTVSGVRVDDQAAQTELLVERTALQVLLPEPLGPGEQVIIELDFQVSVPRNPVR